MVRYLSRSLGAVFFHFTLLAAQPVDTSVVAALTREIEAKVVPAGAVGVLDGTAITCLAAAGMANVETGQPATPDMLFRLGSTTKMFVATAALIVADEGLLDLHAPISTYLADLPPGIRQVTMHQLLTHTAGILDYAPMDGPSDDGALAREIASWTSDHQFLHQGEAFSYSNPGYWLAGRVLEVIDGKPFAEIIRDRVLYPLGMSRSTFRPEVASGFPLAMPHDHDQELVHPPPNHAGTWPSGSLYSSVPDLMRYVSALLNNGILDGKRVLPSKVVRSLLEPQVAIKARPGVLYGYGLIHKTYRGLRVVYHPGSRTGYGSIIDLAPDENIAVVVLGNRTGAQLSSTVRAGFASRIELGPLEEDDLSGGMVVTNRKQMKPYLGLYVNKSPIELEIYNSSVLPFGVGGVLTLRKGYQRIPLRIIDDSTATNGLVRVVFSRSADGTIRLLHYDMHTLKRES